ncbi:hypothetical protein [Streptomyces sp. RKAG293]|uniref:hypothetical protein n=1 Tax=Streptomyces sp. RKAG293 TaxID=2893403 RepID=UPI0020349672|nr:hypothetical protein [Streptomyces sp. RKAG293]MCM2422428.1 hypothetical protein [Streptomyces sp. RKAG293]
MDIRAVVTGFRNVAPLPGLEDAWHWSPAPGINFAGALSADGARLLQTNSRGTFDNELAVAVLTFARAHEEEFFARNPHFGAVAGFAAPGGRGFDVVVGIMPEVHGFYRVEKPDLMQFVRLVFPAHSFEFSGTETVPEAVTRFNQLRMNQLDREPFPFLKMRYANTRSLGRSTNPGRGFATAAILQQELRAMDGGPGSFVEFENRHGKVWRVEWHGAWYLAEWDTQDGEPREIALDELLAFAAARLVD